MGNYRNRHFDKTSPDREKLRLVFIPCLKLIYGSILLSSVALISIEFLLDSDSSSFIFCLFLLLAPPFALLWFTDRPLRLIRKDTKDNTRGVFPLAACFIMIITFLLFDYINNTTGKLTALDNTGELSTAPDTRFYTIEHYAIATKLEHPSFSTINRKDRSRKREIITYFVAPLYTVTSNEEGDLLIPSSTAAPRTWIGLKYYSNSFFPDQQAEVFNYYRNESRKKFVADLKKPITYFERKKLNTNNPFYKAWHSRHRAGDPAPILLIPHYKSFDSRASNGLFWALIVLIAGTAFLYIFVRSTPFNENQIKAYLAGKKYDPSEADVARRKRSKVVKGKLRQNDKLVLVKGMQRKNFETNMHEFCDLYNSEMGQIFPHATELSPSEYAITFPYDVDFDAFCYLVNFMVYPVKGNEKPDVTGWTRAVKGDEWITGPIAGHCIMLYVPKEDREYDNVYVTTDGGACFKFDFGGKTVLQTVVAAPYRTPELDISALPTTHWSEDFE